MGGRVKRITGLAEAAARTAIEHEDLRCALCGRLLGQRVERHHVVPKSEGGTKTAPVHPICHRTIHAFVTNRELASTYGSMDQLRDRHDIREYLRWIARKPPDFRAPTRRRSA
ncbi:HNH endonuclease [Sphingomonas glacialis]|uniref:HNH endonuclease n=1 Tax=Sphingomonas glacialis TaxID=658225 RepID=A0A502G0D5_9SPHN|nr:HNH endonuclease [Sphingomonas glacialis]